jgi:CelD/BcsL family acetyltransferase involved in cellulose biosynthesis
MNHTLNLTEETFANLRARRADASSGLDWPTVFVTPPWLEAWWQTFGGDDDLMLTAVSDGGTQIGIAPLRSGGDVARFVGSPDVCDYLDCIVRPGAEKQFYAALLDGLPGHGIRALELHSLRPESSVMRHLLPLARERGNTVTVTDEDASMELDTFTTWDEYLEALDKKQRHELRRKLRNLDKAGAVSYRSYTGPDDIARQMDTFLTLFTESREDKANFLTASMNGFFRHAVAALAEAGAARVGCLELDGKTVAMLLGFDHGERFNLYNSGYDPACRDLSVGLVCKAYAIGETIGRGMRYDFLKGREVYKSRLGAREIPIRGVRIGLQ